MSDQLQARVRSGVRTTMMGALGSGVIQLSTMVVLARLLNPADYGFFVVALSINALSVQFLASAVERAMVLEQDPELLHGRGLLVASGLASVAVLLFCIVAAIRWALDWQVDLRVLAIVLGGQSLAGLGVASRAMLRRELRFGPVIGSELTGLVLGNLGTAALLGWLGFGALALAGAQVVQFAVTTTWVLATEPRGIRHPRFRQLGTLPALLRGVIKPTTLEAVNGQIAPLVVSSVLGPVPLGLYNRVYSVITFPVQLMVNSVNRVLLSSLATVSTDGARYREAVELMVRAATALITPLALGLAGANMSFVRIILGPKWLVAAPIIPFLAVAVCGTMYGGVLGQSAEARGQFDGRAKVQAWTTGTLVLAVLIGSREGLTGVAIGTMLSCLLYAALNIRLAAGVLGERMVTIMRWSTPGWIAGAACFGAARAVQWAADGAAAPLILAGQILACAAAFFAVLLLLDRTLLVHAVGLVLPKWSDARRAAVVPVGGIPTGPAGPGGPTAGTGL